MVLVTALSAIFGLVTESDASLYIADQRVPISESGEFEYGVTLAPGLNVVVIESYDAAGNVAYQSGLVNAKF